MSTLPAEDNDEAPALRLQEMIAGYRISQAIYVAAKLGIADLLAERPQCSDELARDTATHAPSLHRLLRALAGVGVFGADAEGRWQLTPLAVPLRANVPGSLRDVAILYGEPWSWAPWGELLHSVRTGEAAFGRVYGVERFAYLAQRPEANAVFNAAMSAGAETSAAAMAAYDFTGIGTLVDVGGGQGTTLVAILRAHPDLRGVLFDRPHVVEGASARLAAAGVAERCTVVGGDFFAGVPTGGDAYLLKFVLHDWDDDRALAILRSCRRAVGAQAKLLVVELVTEPDDGPSDPLLVDLHMLVAHAGRERTPAEFRDLFAAAGFTLTRIVPTASSFRVIEAVPA